MEWGLAMIGFKQTKFAVIFITGLTLGNTANANLQYNITDLGAFSAIGINASGQVAIANNNPAEFSTGLGIL